MDWNWFFSSLSQSSASIVGIFGAFIITKILSNNSNFDKNNLISKELIALSDKIVDDANDRYFKWYNKHTNESAFSDAKKYIQKGIYNPDEIYGECKFSVYSPKSKIIEHINLLIDKHKEKVAAELQRNKDRPAGITAIPRPSFLDAMPVVPVIGLEVEQEAIDSVVRNARHQIRTISNHLNNIKNNPEYSEQISYTLGLIVLLFFSGVIYPLSFMPLRPNSTIHLSLEAFWNLLFTIRGLLLGIVSFTFISIISMFYRMNLKMKYDSEIVSKLEIYTKLSSYSHYFDILENNLNGSVVRPGQEDE